MVTWSHAARTKHFTGEKPFHIRFNGLCWPSTMQIGNASETIIEGKTKQQS